MSKTNGRMFVVKTGEYKITSAGTSLSEATGCVAIFAQQLCPHLLIFLDVT